MEVALEILTGKEFQASIDLKKKLLAILFVWQIGLCSLGANEEVRVGRDDGACKKKWSFADRC